MADEPPEKGRAVARLRWPLIECRRGEARQDPAAGSTRAIGCQHPVGDLCNLLRRNLGFEERTSSSHHLFVKHGVEDLINLQRESGKAKPYQVQQVRKILLRYGLGSED